MDSLNENKFNVFVFINDGKGRYHEAIEWLYQIALGYKNKGCNVVMLHENKDYTIPTSIDERYSQIKHLSFASLVSEDIQISVRDLIIIPDAYMEVVETLRKQKVPAEIIIAVQNIDVMYDMMEIGGHLMHMGVRQVFVMHEYVKNYLEAYFKGVAFHVITPYTQSCYNNQYRKPKDLTVILCDGSELLYTRLIKKFYLKHPQYSFVPFKVIDDSSSEQTALNLQNASLLVSLNYGVLNASRVKQALACDTAALMNIQSYYNYKLSMSFDENDNIPIYLSDANISNLEDGISVLVDKFLTGTLYLNENEYVTYNENNFIGDFEVVSEKVKANRIEFLENNKKVKV